DEIQRSSQFHRLHLGGDVGEDAALGGNGEALAGACYKLEKLNQCAERIGDGVDADNRVAGAEHEAVDDGGGDAGGIVGWVVGLEARGESAGETDRGAESCND